MREVLRSFFDRMLQRWEASGLGLPRAPWDPDVDPGFWRSDRDEEDYAAWQPLEKTMKHDIGATAPDLSPLHVSIHSYFNSWWFASLEGYLGQHGITLLPVLPEAELDAFVPMARRYATAHGGRLAHVPVGVEFNGQQVVVDNRTGAVAIEDFEQARFETIAPSLEALIDSLDP